MIEQTSFPWEIESCSQYLTLYLLILWGWQVANHQSGWLLICGYRPVDSKQCKHSWSSPIFRNQTHLQDPAKVGVSRWSNSPFKMPSKQFNSFWCGKLSRQCLKLQVLPTPFPWTENLAYCSYLSFEHCWKKTGANYKSPSCFRYSFTTFVMHVISDSAGDNSPIETPQETSFQCEYTRLQVRI